MAGQGPPVSFRSVELEQQLASRSDGGQPAGQLAKRDLTRYYELLHHVLWGKAEGMPGVELDEEEALLLCETLRPIVEEGPYATRRVVGWTTAAYNVAAPFIDPLYFDTYDAATRPIAQRLVHKAVSWHLAERCAVLDAVERFWLRVREAGAEDAPKALREVGLVRES